MTPSQVQEAMQAIEAFEAAKAFRDRWRGCHVIDIEVAGSKAVRPGSGSEISPPHGLLDALTATFGAWIVANVREKKERCVAAGVEFEGTEP